MEKGKLEDLRIERPPERPSARWPWIALAIVLFIALIGGGYYLLRGAALPEVRTVFAREGTRSGPDTVLNASGYVTARRQATVSSKFTGKVIEVLIEEGMHVAEGQILARLDDANIRVAFQLAQAERVSEKRGLEETRALLREARINFDRTRRLVDKGLASEAELDRSRALAESLEAQLARRKADVKVAERQIGIYRQQLEDSIIRAPFAGVVVAKNAQPGEMISPVSAGGGFTRTGIGTIVDMSSLEIEIDVNEAYINRVEPGQRVIATLDAYPDWRIPCRVIAIVPTADRQRATVEVRVGFDELDARILPDMGVKVAFQDPDAAPDRAASLSVPRGAVRAMDGRDYVFVLQDGRAERRAVAVGAQTGGMASVLSGISAGEKIIVEGPEDLADGDEVKERDG